MAGRKLGQHFLIRGSILERIAAEVCGSHEDTVIEIGPGRGALTEKLLRRASRVVAVEVDPLLVEHLRRKFAGDPRLELIHADVLATDLAQWGPAAIAGNLPYYITSPIISRITALGPLVRRAVILVQKEVAERLAAAPGSRDYGLLSVEVQLFADVRVLFDVSPRAFHPPPNVDSAVVRLDPRDRASSLGIHDARGFLNFVAHCFRQKRKTLRNNLVMKYDKSVIDAWPEASRRAEQIPLEKFAEMYLRLVS